MIVSGLQKMTLLDYPGKVACTIFLPGCNFRCPFCHNSALIAQGTEERLEEEEVFRFLEKRRGLLDAVCISGGEPTLQPELEEFIRRIRAMGYLVKLDTNGSNPELLERLVTSGLVDYVAMDVKNSPSRYAQTAGLEAAPLEKLAGSLRFLLTQGAEYELRTTVVQELHDEASIREIGLWLRELAPQVKAKRFFIQPFIDRESVLFSGLHAPKREDLEAFVQAIRPYVQWVKIRGLE